MDFSKLPKLSQTPNPEAPVPAPNVPAPVVRFCRCGAPLRAEARFCDTCGAAVPAGSDESAIGSIGAEAWISIAVGLILLLMAPRFLQWLSSQLFGTYFNPFRLPDGTIIPYPKVPEFWSDLGPTLFGLLLLWEGLVFVCLRKRLFLWITFAFTILVTLYNLWYVISSYSSHGLALISALAVAFGGYLAMYQWRLLQAMR